MEHDLPNLRHLRAFCEVARQRSISRAAQFVFLSQPAITQAIAKLESMLDMALFERHSDGMHATEAGGLFAERVERALEQIRSGCHEALRAGGERLGRRPETPEQVLTTTQMRALVTVASTRNFSLAARSIGTSQPALYRAARDLEGLLGLSLFEKTGQGINLTRPGLVLAQHFKLAIAELSQGFAEVHALRGVETGRIVVGSMPLSRQFILPTAINGLAQSHPEVSVRVIEGPYAELLHGLRHGDIDVLVGALRESLPVDDVVQEALFDDPLVVVARSGHPLVGKKRLGPADLAAYPWAIAAPGTPTREYFDRLFAGQPPAGLVESGSMTLIRSLLMNSDRLTLISARQVRLEQELSLLTTLPYALPDTRRPIGLTTRRNWWPTTRQALFLDLLRAASRA